VFDKTLSIATDMNEEAKVVVHASVSRPRQVRTDQARR
jgi:hypothetical protein